VKTAIFTFIGLCFLAYGPLWGDRYVPELAIVCSILWIVLIALRSVDPVEENTRKFEISDNFYTAFITSNLLATVVKGWHPFFLLGLLGAIDFLASKSAEWRDENLVWVQRGYRGHGHWKKRQTENSKKDSHVCSRRLRPRPHFFEPPGDYQWVEGTIPSTENGNPPD
jgi:hypothetical protein